MLLMLGVARLLVVTHPACATNRAHLTGLLYLAKGVSDVHLVADGLSLAPTARPRLAQRLARHRSTTDNPPSTFDLTLTPRATLEMLPPRP